MKKIKCKPLAHFESAFLLLLAILLTLPSSVSGQETYRFERMWPTLPQPWYFSYPQAIAIGPDGSVYIADSGFCRIQKFTQDGQFITAGGNREQVTGSLDTMSLKAPEISQSITVVMSMSPTRTIIAFKNLPLMVYF